MSINMGICPLCDRKPDRCNSVRNRDLYEYFCPQCGEFTITEELAMGLASYVRQDKLIRYRLQRYLHDYGNDGKILFTEGPCNPIEGYMMIDADEVMTLYNNELSMLWIFNETLKNMAEKSKDGVVELTERYRWDIPTLYDATAVNVLFALIDDGFATGTVESAWSFNIVITIKGHGHAVELVEADSTMTHHGIVSSTTSTTTFGETSGSDVSTSSVDDSHPPSPGPKVFLSHSHADSQFVKRLATDLEDQGIMTWYDEWDLALGHSLTIQIQEGIQSSGFFVVVLSPDSVSSDWVRTEWTAAFSHEMESRRIVVIPIWLVNCDIPIIIKDKYRADFRDEEMYSDKLAELVRNIRGEPHPRGGR
ncbi:MAG: toll/interleukin-1 receptor domain-containing protein [Armatimonadota bacterium]